MMEKSHPEKTVASDKTAPPSPQQTDGGIRIAALAAAAHALKPKKGEADKQAHPLPPCLKDMDRQTD
jgi:hypothetical protein